MRNKFFAIRVDKGGNKVVELLSLKGYPFALILFISSIMTVSG